MLRHTFFSHLAILRRKPRELAFAGRPGVVIDAPLAVREAGFSLHAASRAGAADEQESAGSDLNKSE